MRIAAHIALLSLLGGAGCVSIGGGAPAPPAYRYQLDYPSPTPAARSFPGNLRLLQIRAASAYDRLDIAYREQGHGFGNYNYRRWTSHPGSMIGDLIARDLVEARLFAAVLQGPSALTPDYVLDGVVESIEERISGGCTAHLRIRFTLTRRESPASSQAVFQKPYEANRKCAGETAEDLVAAMSEALASISAELLADIARAVDAQ